MLMRPITEAAQVLLYISYVSKHHFNPYSLKYKVRLLVSRPVSITTLFLYAEIRDWTQHIQIWGGDDTWAHYDNFIQILKEQRVC